MPAGTSETRHTHVRARQLFYVLEEELTPGSRISLSLRRTQCRDYHRHGEVSPRTPVRIANAF